MLELVDTISARSHCHATNCGSVITSKKHVCHATNCGSVITSKKHVKANLGTGAPYRYHISCFVRENGAAMKEILEAQEEISPKWATKANKPKPEWTLKRVGHYIKLRGPNIYNEAHCHEVVSPLPAFDVMLQMEGKLSGDKYLARLLTAQQLANPKTRANCAKIKARYLGVNEVIHRMTMGNLELPFGGQITWAHVEKVYLVEAIKK